MSISHFAVVSAEQQAVCRVDQDPSLTPFIGCETNVMKM